MTVWIGTFVFITLKSRAYVAMGRVEYHKLANCWMVVIRHVREGRARKKCLEFERIDHLRKFGMKNICASCNASFV